MKCRDCGEVKESEMKYRHGRDQECIVRQRSSRPDICDECWDLRLELIRRAKSGEISHEAFLSTQKKMGRGKTRKAIEAVLR